MPIEINIQSILITAGLRITGALVVLLIGRWIARLLQRSVQSLLKRATLSPALTQVILRGVYYLVLLIATFSALVILGIPADTLLGALGILVVVAAIALRESLRDLAATVNFVIFQPFKVGDLIQTNGMVGMVKEILPFNTILITPDQQQAILPNGNIQNTTIVNLTALPQTRLNLTVHLSYSDDVSATKEALLEIANADPRVLQTPPPVVDVMDLDAGQVKYILRVFTQSLDAWVLQPALNERIKLLIEQKQLSVPLPQMQILTDQNLS